MAQYTKTLFKWQTQNVLPIPHFVNSPDSAEGDCMLQWTSTVVMTSSECVSNVFEKQFLWFIGLILTFLKARAYNPKKSINKINLGLHWSSLNKHITSFNIFPICEQSKLEAVKFPGKILFQIWKKTGYEICILRSSH